jgi:outer membrane protein assembly factor BamB
VGGSSTPRTLWSVEDQAGAAATPFADADIAVFTALSAPRVVALDATTGALRWSKWLDGVPGDLGMPASSIVSYGDEIVVGGWNLFAFSRATGDARWSFTSGSEYTAAAPIAVAGNLIVSPGSVGRLFAVDATTGALVWERVLGERPTGPSAANGVIYVAASGYAQDGVTLAAGHAYAIQASDGAILWSAPLPNSPNGEWLGGAGGSGALATAAYIVASPSGRVWAFDRVTGAVVWTFDAAGPVLSGVAVIGGVAVVAATTGDIYGLDVNDGSPRWHGSTGGSSVLEQVTADSNCAYVPVVELLCYSQSGELQWRVGGASRGGPLFRTAAYSANGRLYLGSLSGYHALAKSP